MNDYGVNEMSKVDTMLGLSVQMDNTRQLLAKLEQKASELRLATLREVEMIKNDVSITLVFNGRRINAKKNIRNRFVVKEGKTTLKNEYFGSIHDLRFDLAVGNI